MKQRDGNDGPWSYFAVQIGTPAQYLKVFVSTSAKSTLAVSPKACNISSSDYRKCANSRGGIFDPSKSTSWEPTITNLSSNFYPLSFDPSLGYNGDAEFGFDNITLGAVMSLDNQTVGGYADIDSYLAFSGCARGLHRFLARGIQFLVIYKICTTMVILLA